jgi:hypothetical protein
VVPGRGGRSVVPEDWTSAEYGDRHGHCFGSGGERTHWWPPPSTSRTESQPRPRRHPGHCSDWPPAPNRKFERQLDRKNRSPTAWRRRGPRAARRATAAGASRPRRPKPPGGDPGGFGGWVDRSVVRREHRALAAIGDAVAGPASGRSRRRAWSLRQARVDPVRSACGCRPEPRPRAARARRRLRPQASLG